ncbi:MAG: acyl-coenzyme A thioesterase PaaI-like protein, partial [Paraglaciecola sp.]
MGNPIHKILHGGVIAAILYTVGGLMAVIYAVKDIAN